ncbi:MAG: PAS domain-containing protein [Desulfobacterales bacterium]|nr:PAS domain-containing protein [Desulfobacterales bacterium]
MPKKPSYEELENQIKVLEKKIGQYESEDKTQHEPILINILEGSPVPMFVIDNNHVVKFWNNALSKLTGLKAGDVVGTTDPWKAFYKDKRPVMADLIVERADKKEFWDYYKDNSEYTTMDKCALKQGAFESLDFFKKFGEKGKWLFVTACPMTDDQGNILGAIETLQDVTDRTLAEKALKDDITQRKKIEKELRHLQNYLSNIINSMPSVLIGLDEKCKITQWNSQAEIKTGILAKHAQGKDIIRAFPHLGIVMEKIQKAIKDGKTQEDKKVSRRFDDKNLYEDITIYPFVTNGVEGVVVHIDDVSNQVRLEKMMIQSEKMLSVGGLAAGMAHEINNPLAGMIQNAQVIQSRLTKNIPANDKAALEAGTTMESIKKYMDKRGILDQLEIIRETGYRAAIIIQNMLAFVRQSDTDSNKSVQNIDCVLDKTIELAQSDYDLKNKFDFKEIKIVKEYDSKLPGVICEQSKIQQVFLNILKNGAEAMHDGKERPEIPQFTLRILKDKDMVKIEVEDNGPGIDPIICKRIFEPFFTTKSVGKGTGLGLSVSYLIIVEDHGGSMEVESTIGKGTKFIIKLPSEKISLKEV